MPWDFSDAGWYAFARGSSIRLTKGPKNYSADVAVYSFDSADGKPHKEHFVGGDKQLVAIKALAFLQSKTGKKPVQIDIQHSGTFPVKVRTEDDEIKEAVEYGLTMNKLGRIERLSYQNNDFLKLGGEGLEP